MVLHLPKSSQFWTRMTCSADLKQFVDKKKLKSYKQISVVSLDKSLNKII